jgi:hypothetical protein
MLYRVKACVNSLDSRFDHGPTRHAAALLTSAGAVALVTGAIFALDSVAPRLVRRAPCDVLVVH